MNRILLFFGVLLVNSQLFAQVKLPKFESDIRKFEIEDSIAGLKPGAVLFTGSSSIRMWKTLDADMAPLQVINRGFGGSTIPEVIYYADRIILPHKPDILVLYCGENDISNDETTSDDVLNSFKAFHQYLRKNLPKTQLYFISMKPSISRWTYWPKIQEANLKIAAFIKKRKKYHYIDTASKMLDSSGVVFQDIFIKDNLHMNEKGYAIWTDVMKPELEKAVAR